MIPLQRLTGWPPGRGVHAMPCPRSGATSRSLTPRGLKAVACALSLLACAGERASQLGVADARLRPCPPSPNCVGSDASDPAHRVPAFELAVPAPKAWDAARRAVAELPRTVIVSETPDYLHAECSSAIFGFVDDLELELRASQGLIAVRSASRLGYGDLGVNLRRVEQLRAALVQQGVVR